MEKQELTTIDYVRIGVTIFALLLAFLFAGLNAWYTKQHDATQITNQSRLNELTQELNNIVEPEDTVDVIQERLSSATDAGNAVSDIQNQYLDYSNDDRSLDLFEEMHAYFEANSACGSWIRGIAASGPDDGALTWKFMSTFSFSGNDVNVVWRCETEKTHVLYSYVTAVYHADTHMFDNWSAHETYDAATNYTVTEGYDDSEQNTTGDVDVNTTLTPDEYEAVAREEQREMYEQGIPDAPPMEDDMDMTMEMEDSQLPTH